MSRILSRRTGAALALTAVSLTLLSGVASAAEPPSPPAAGTTCEIGDVCVWSQDGTQMLVFDQPEGQMPDLFRYFPGPGPEGSWANGVYRMVNNTNVSVQLQDVDIHPPTIVGVVGPGQDVSVPEVPLNLADRLLIMDP